MSNGQYQLVIHRAAETELDDLNEPEKTQLKDALRGLKTEEEPTNTPVAGSLKDNQNLFRVKVDGVRALCTLDKPALKVLLVGEREGVYNRIEVAKARAGL